MGPAITDSDFVMIILLQRFYVFDNKPPDFLSDVN
jgi:hypothetical protein